MSKCVLRSGREIADYASPYIVAEVNSSHNGDMATAKKMIDEAKSAGCDCVKFQSWTTDTLYSKSFYLQNPIAKRMVKKFEFSKDALKALSDYCAEKEIDFSSTPYSEQEADALANEFHSPYIKIASMELNNYPFIRYIARLGVPIVLSTGMGEMDEIEKAVDAIASEGNRNICLLHCISVYPTEPSDARLLNIVGLRKRFLDYPIGFSDHTIGMETAIAATALGSALIEKHMTLSRQTIGMDNQMAMEPDELREFVFSCKRAHLSLGGEERLVSEKERQQREKMRRSIVTARPLEAGTILTDSDLDTKRPGSGFSPDKMDALIGKKLTHDMDEGIIFLDSDITD